MLGCGTEAVLWKTSGSLSREETDVLTIGIFLLCRKSGLVLESLLGIVFNLVLVGVAEEEEIKLVGNFGGRRGGADLITLVGRGGGADSITETL